MQTEANNPSRRFHINAIQSILAKYILIIPTDIYHSLNKIEDEGEYREENRKTEAKRELKRVTTSSRSIHVHTKAKFPNPGVLSYRRLMFHMQCIAGGVF